MYSFIQPFLSWMTTLIPVVSALFLAVNLLTIFIAKYRYARGTLPVSKHEFDSKMRQFKMMNVVIAGGAVVFTGGAYLLQSFYARF